MGKSTSSTSGPDVVLTPAGPRSMDQVHLVEPGDAVRMSEEGTPEIVSDEKTNTIRSRSADGGIGLRPVERIFDKVSVMSDYVLTPAGPIHKSRVHKVEPGFSLDGARGQLTKLDPNRRVIQEFGAIPVSDLAKTARARAQARVVPGLGTGWIVNSGWWNATGRPIDRFATTWTVPSPPLNQSDQLLYIFNGMQDAGANYIFQPVLQWGRNGADGGSFWQVATWYVTGTVGFHSTFVRVNPGDVLTGVMTLTGQTATPAATLFNYYGEFAGIQSTGYAINNMSELLWAAETLEAYRIDEASDYACRRLSMRAIDITTGGVAPSMSWTAQNRVTDCGQDTEIVSNATPGGEVNLYSYDLKQIAVANNADGRMELFYTSRNDGLYHRWQAAPSSGWADDWPLGFSNYARQLVATQNADGRLEVFYVGTNDRIYHNWQTAPNNGWVGEFTLGGWAKQITVERNQDGRLEIFYVGTNDRIYHNWQEAPNSGWSGESALGGWGKQVVAGRNQDGRLEIFYVGTNDRIYHNWQTAPNNGWSGEFEMGGWAKQLAVGSNLDGRLEIFYIGTNDRIYHNWQVAPNSGWSGEAELGGLAKQLVVGRNADGRLEIFYIGTDDRLYHRWQVVPNGWWSGEAPMGGLARQITIGRNADGRLELFYVGTNNALYQNWQVAPNSGWSGERRV